MASSWHPLNSSLYLWSKGRLANIVLSRLGDRAEMAHSVEACTPSLDYDFTKYVNGVPPTMKVPYNKHNSTFTEKSILSQRFNVPKATQLAEF
jgi:asparagine synthase (glutamine-hydrolysing)